MGKYQVVNELRYSCLFCQKEHFRHEETLLVGRTRVCRICARSIMDVAMLHGMEPRTEEQLFGKEGRTAWERRQR